MPTYFIRREGVAAKAAELDAVFTRLRQFEEAPGVSGTRWIRSYALREPDGRFGLACIFEADSTHNLQSHALHTRLPACEIVPVVDTVAVRAFAPALVYLVRRRSGWASQAHLDEAAREAHGIGEAMSSQVSWLRTYVVREPDGSLGTVCVYQAISADALRAHAARVPMPADELTPVVGRVIFRADGLPPGLPLRLRA